MKNLFIIVPLFLFYNQTVFSQLSFTPNFGINTSLSKLDKNIPNQLPKKQSDFYIGANLNYKLLKRISFNLDMLYSPKRFYFPIGNSPIRVTYWDLQESTEFSFNKFWSIYFGLNLGLNIKEERYIFSTNSWKMNTAGIFSDEIDFGAVLGSKIHYKKLTLFAHFNRSILNIVSNFSFTNENGELLPDVFLRNRNLQIGLGYTFGKENKVKFFDYF